MAKQRVEIEKATSSLSLVISGIKYDIVATAFSHNQPGIMLSIGDKCIASLEMDGAQKYNLLVYNGQEEPVKIYKDL